MASQPIQALLKQSRIFTTKIPCAIFYEDHEQNQI